MGKNETQHRQECLCHTEFVAQAFLPVLVLDQIIDQV